MAVTARIDLDALRQNVAFIRSKAPQSRILGIVKANAYGHGLREVALALETEALAVARIDEGVMLRESGELRPLVVLEGCQQPREMQLAAKHDLQVVVHNMIQCSWFSAARPVQTWLKVDTGMHRLGLDESNFRALAKAPRPGMQLVGLMSHLGFSGIESDARTDAQVEAFARACQGFDLPRSIANSGAVLSCPASQLDWVRPGILLYGISPFAHQIPELKPVMTLSSRVIAVKRVRAGDTVGYGGRFTARRDTWIAVIAAGYGDGYPAATVDGAPVRINGRRYGIAGAVSMDMCCCDVGSSPTVAVGDEAILWGERLPIEIVAAASQLSAYVMTTQLTGRVRYSFVG